MTLNDDSNIHPLSNDMDNSGRFNINEIAIFTFGFYPSSKNYIFAVNNLQKYC